MLERQARVAALCDGVRTSRQIGTMLDESHKYVQEVMLKFDLPRRGRGSAFGALNGSYKSGRRIDRDGYALTSAPAGHPYARPRANRNTGLILEHRLVLERHLGRYLLPTETVDHKDGLRLHNDPDNLRLFDCNADHLRATIAGQVPGWSAEGQAKLKAPAHLRAILPQVDTYDRMKKSGDARLKSILLTAWTLGAESPFLLGSSLYLERAGISDLSRPSLERALADLHQRYA